MVGRDRRLQHGTKVLFLPEVGGLWGVMSSASVHDYDMRRSPSTGSRTGHLTKPLGLLTTDPVIHTPEMGHGGLMFSQATCKPKMYPLQ